ncbi:histone deacetylase 8 isoform X2 [Aplysia californica]|uniref:Histone deacetylase 8 n=1 Tax=Aplysia californica TaxID=6500 RepID=A0ABM0ZX75_APLCA|nr:histone deacetylase 8 isoform X2 [Aplysia californica]
MDTFDFESDCHSEAFVNDGINKNTSVNALNLVPRCGLLSAKKRGEEEYAGAKVGEAVVPVPFEVVKDSVNGVLNEKVNNNSQKENENQLSSSLEAKEDPFDLSNDDSQEMQTYKPLKRKLNCTPLSDEVKNAENKVSMTQDSTDTGNCVSATPFECSSDDNGLSCQDNKRAKTSLRVTYVHSEELKCKTNELIRIEKRAELVHSLIRVYGLLQYVELLEPRHAEESEILGFHCSDYINCLRGIGSCSDSEEISDKLSSEAEGYGLSYDCPQQTGVFETASLISGATITAAESLLNGSADIAINWYGGWHHAKRDSASGFCYINDIVLGILKLREKYDRVLYVDLDLHHGDGVEEAFEMTSKVMTVSFHKFSTGFFPGSGSLESVGTGRGKFYTVNVPLKDGIKDAEFYGVFCRVMKTVQEKFPGQAVVVQCGADSLSDDPMASFNLTHVGLAKCVCFLLSWNLPTLLLGGGGYNFPNTAKCWTFLTALAARRKLPMDIPEHEHLLEYGPGYDLSTSVGNRKDCNSHEYLSHVVTTVCST